MAVSRRNIQSLFLKDRDRAAKLREAAFQKSLTQKNFGDRVLSGVIGAGTGFVASGFNPVGAAAGAVKGATTDASGLEALGQTALSGFSAGQVAPTGGLEALAKPENLGSTMEVFRAATGDPLKPLERKFAKSEKAKAEKAKLASEIAKEDRDHEKKKELAGLKNKKKEGAASLQNIIDSGMDQINTSPLWTAGKTNLPASQRAKILLEMGSTTITNLKKSLAVIDSGVKKKDLSRAQANTMKNGIRKSISDFNTRISNLQRQAEREE